MTTAEQDPIVRAARQHWADLEASLAAMSDEQLVAALIDLPWIVRRWLADNALDARDATRVV